MLKLRVIRPNTIGLILEKSYESYKDAENFIESQCEKLADKGLNLSELKGSSSKQGTIECTHERYSDSLLITWETED